MGSALSIVSTDERRLHSDRFVLGASWGRWALSLLHQKFASEILSFDLPRIFLTKYRFKHGRRQVLQGTTVPARANHVDLRLALFVYPRAHWERNLKRMERSWRHALAGSLIALPASLALLRAEITSDKMRPRATVILAIALSKLSIASGSMLLSGYAKLNTAHKRSQWIHASTQTGMHSSIDFWACLAWPLTSALWSGILCVISITSIVYDIEDADHPLTDRKALAVLHTVSEMGEIILILIGLMACIQTYRSILLALK